MNTLIASMQVQTRNNLKIDITITSKNNPIGTEYLCKTVKDKEIINFRIYNDRIPHEMLDHTKAMNELVQKHINKCNTLQDIHNYLNNKKDITLSNHCFAVECTEIHRY